MLETKHCPRHPETETNLRCGKCEELVCPRCLVHSPVGVRCPECAQLKRLPTFEVSRTNMARAIAVGLVLGIAGGLVAGVIIRLFAFPFLDLIAFAGVGYAIGEGISLSVNRRRGRTLKFIAAGGAFIASVIIISLAPFITIYTFLAVAAAIWIAINRF